MKKILSDWNFMRFLRLGLGIFILVEGFQNEVWMYVALGGLFSVMALLNAGGCAMGSCTTETKNRTSARAEEAVYEEIK